MGSGHKKNRWVCMHFARWCGFPQNVRKRLLQANGGARAAPRPLDEWLLGHWGPCARAQNHLPRAQRVLVGRPSIGYIMYTTFLEYMHLYTSKIRRIKHVSSNTIEYKQDTNGIRLRTRYNSTLKRHHFYVKTTPHPQAQRVLHGILGIHLCFDPLFNDASCSVTMDRMLAVPLWRRGAARPPFHPRAVVARRKGGTGGVRN